MPGRHAPTGAKLATKVALRRFGLEASRPGGRLLQSRVRRIVVPNGFALADVREGRPLHIDLGRITTSYGFSYADGGWHPYWATLLAYQQDPRLDALQSPLGRFFSRFQPKSVQEVLFPTDRQPLPPLDGLHPRYAPVVWTLTPRGLAKALDESSAGAQARTNMSFGPAPEGFVRAEFDRLCKVYDSVRLQGYRPGEHAEGYVEGFFLVRGGDYRFVPTEGQHRLAALRVLGVEEVQAVPRLSLSAVRAGDLARWTTAHGGIYEPALTELIFDRLWSANGVEHRDLHALQ